MTQLSYRQLLDRHRPRLDDPSEAELLLVRALGKSRAWLYAHYDDPVTHGPETERFLAWIEQRAAGQPVAYLLGEREFYGRSFQVSPAVLIPRPETELLVDLALELSLSPPCSALDIGTGSGAIALTLAAERPDWHLTATDLSEAALRIAAGNRDQLGLSKVELLRGDLFEAIGDRTFDLIVSNPPYIAEGDPHLDRGDLRFEPAMALSSGQDGLALIDRLIEEAPSHLKRGGFLLIEHGHDQAEQLRRRLAAAGFAQAQSWRDLAGIERVSGACWPG
ncbi:peptide chain release factor N(5)-glutamine methyltransferase [Wenzhouxiangella marina]|uniref:Release factor glutamine methyltransferase n=1 Tax=Wenzhouxiangella marina TaxID=1579979 RepID=A0A0K0XWF6_9GAMM|nr:peptide chain release factor N(5)-glutamine methyltransferase [Wenzhouxiangella marina]AKS42013.1 HemK family modification methylase [Wenzhouxiangella marina]MBB6086219.1 release factor glutamine methyltransferase [Wenzhouxiangella marina]